MSNDLNQQILGEVRKMRKGNQWGIIIALLFLAILFGYYFVDIAPRIRQQFAAGPWTQINAAMERLDYEKALEIAQQETAKWPNAYYGHEYLGAIYLAMGEAKKAEAEYARAYELYPSAEIEGQLKILRKRQQNEAEKSNQKGANPRAAVRDELVPTK